jgi:hypothetical protein
VSIGQQSETLAFKTVTMGSRHEKGKVLKSFDCTPAVARQSFRGSWTAIARRILPHQRKLDDLQFKRESTLAITNIHV